MNKSLQKEECCPECSTPASGAPDETQKECLNKNCKYCHMYSINTEQTIREEERVKCRGLLEEVKKEIEDCKLDVLIPEYSNERIDMRINGFNSALSTCISILEDKLKEIN